LARFDFRNMKIFQGLAREGVKRGNMAVAKLAQNSMRDNFSRVGRYKSSAPGTPPNIRRGFLRRSIQVRPKGDMSAEVWSDAVYAKILDRGGVIRPKTSKYLVVPVNNAARRFSEVKQGSLRNYPFSFQKSKNGRLFLVGNFSKSAGYYTNSKGKRVRVTPKSEPRFILKKSIQIARRPFIQPTLDRIKGSESLRYFKGGIEHYIKRRFGVEFKI
jgi:hypothetical protein